MARKRKIMKLHLLLVSLILFVSNSIAATSDNRELLIRQFFLAAKITGGVSFDLPYLAQIGDNWEKSTAEINLSSGCLLIGSLYSKATLGEYLSDYLDKTNPIESEDKDLNAYTARGVYFSTISSIMSNVKYVMAPLVQICTDVKDTSKLKSEIQTKSKYLKERIKRVDEERKHAIEVSGLSDILRE